MRLFALWSSLLVASLAAQAPPTAASMTEPGRTLARPLDIVIGGPSREPVDRTLMVVLDPTAGLAEAGFAEAFAVALAANQKLLTRTRIGLGIVGEKGCIVVPPTLEHDELVAAIGARLRRPAAGFQNVYASAREAVGAFGGGKGERVLLLVTLENGDVEDDVERTVAVLSKAKVKAVVLTSEATLADSYWAARKNQQKPRRTTLTGADGAAIDLPWGWLFQVTPANELTPAGYAMWGLSRLAAATGGRVFLHASSNQIEHRCAVHASCLFCSGDHQPVDDNWHSALVAQLAPLVGSRSDSLSAMARDPSFRAMIATWRAAAKAGLVRSQPAIKVAGTSARPDRDRGGRALGLTDTASFRRNAKNAEAAAAKAKALGDALAATLAELPAESTSMRGRAAAQYTVVLLQLTRVNLLTFAAWCREDAAELFDAALPEPLPPEQLPFDDDRRPSGIGFTSMSLCHGVKPFYAVELPGGETLRPELERLDALFTGFQVRYGKSQFGYALRRNGIARFWPTFPGVTGSRPRPRPKSGNEPTGPITPRRPSRSGGGSAGAPSGPVTGGRK